MKKMMKKIFVLLMIILILIEINTVALAGMADFGDEDAAIQANKQMQEQENELSQTVNKSSNNYLASLKVEGIELSPKFDKQTLEYSIKSELDVDNINIIAVAEDSKASINGTGIVQLQKGENNIRIDVEAENGTVRTYFIKVTRKIDNKNNEEIDNTIAESPDETIDTNADLVVKNETIEQVEDKFKSNNILPLIVLVVVIILIMLMFKKSPSKKGRRK